MMHLIKLTKDNKDFTFCTNGKVLLLNDINVPMLFTYKSEALNYIRGCMDTHAQHGLIFDYQFDFVEVGEKEEA